jgi:enoyl-CoA hydratase/carnithine racemase
MPAPTFETLLYAVEDGIATITLNRPERMNAFTARMMKDLIEVFDVTDADDAVKVVIVTGAGRAFCAGADLGAGGATFDRTAPGAGAGRGQGRRHLSRRRRPLHLRMYESLKPIIAAVNGAAVGVGVTMQLPMDIRLASTDAKFGFVFARRGINPEAASSWFLPRLVGMQTALEWCYTGRVFGAQEALERGLVRSLHAPEDLLPAARALAREIADNSAPVSVALTVSCCGAWPARTIRWRPTRPTAGPSSRAARPATPRRGDLVPGEAHAGLSGQGLDGFAGHLAGMGRTSVPVIHRFL